MEENDANNDPRIGKAASCRHGNSQVQIKKLGKIKSHNN